MERQSQAIPLGFDICFFPRPAAEESGSQFLARQMTEGLPLRVREKALRQLLHISVTAYVPNIYADGSLLRKCHQRKPMGVRDVKAQVAVALQNGFSMDSIAKPHVLGRTTEITGQQKAKCSACYNEIIA